MRARWPWVGALLGVVALAGCATGDPQAQPSMSGQGVEQGFAPFEELGACPSDLDLAAVEFARAIDAVLGIPRWTEVSAGALRIEERPGDGEGPVQVVVPERSRPVRGEASPSWRANPDTAALMATELELGATLLVGSNEESSATVVLSLRPDGTAGALGGCADQITGWLRSVALDPELGAKGLTEVEIAREVVAEPDTPVREALMRQAAEVDEPRAWTDLPPQTRNVAPGETPAEILETLIRLRLDLVVPDAWRDFDVTLCPRLTLGWSTCTNLDAGSPGVVLQLDTWAEPGQPLELWLLDKDGGRFDTARGPVHIIPADMLDDEGELLLTGNPKISSVEQMLEGQGRVFEISDVKG